MSFTVVFTDEASFQVLQIEEWIAERSIRGAATWQSAFQQAISKLTDRGPGFSLAPESSEFIEPIRQIFFRTRRGLTYRALFIVLSNLVIVVCVRGCGQDLADPDTISIPE